jgi:hypothetical protein
MTTATYFIGDIQGCDDQLGELLHRIEQRSPSARYLFAGDLVNRAEILCRLCVASVLCNKPGEQSVLGNRSASAGGCSWHTSRASQRYAYRNIKCAGLR